MQNATKVQPRAEIKDRIVALKDHCSPGEYAELTVLYNARQKAFGYLLEDPTAQRKKDHDALREALLQELDSLETYYLSPANRTAAPGAADPTDVLFRNSTEMFEHLKDRGWGISSRQTLTNHAKSGSLQLQPDRSITAKAFDAWKLHPDGGLRYYEAYVKNRRDELGTIEDNALKKSAEELKAIEFKNRKAAREEQIELGTLISRADADAQTCTWASLTRDAIASRTSRALPAIIHATGGQIAALAEAQALLDQAIDQACNDIAESGPVDVVLEPIDDKTTS